MSELSQSTCSLICFLGIKKHMNEGGGEKKEEGEEDEEKKRRREKEEKVTDVQ